MILSPADLQLLDAVAEQIHIIKLATEFEQLVARMTGEEVTVESDDLLLEARDVASRLIKLNAFMATDDFPKLPQEDKDLLYEQSRAMSHYVQILGKRLGRAGSQFSHTPPPAR